MGSIDRRRRIPRMSHTRRIGGQMSWTVSLGICESGTLRCPPPACASHMRYGSRDGTSAVGGAARITSRSDAWSASSPQCTDPLDANYRRAREPDDLGSSQALSSVVHASRCASLLLYVLLYVLLYRTDVYLPPGQLDRTLTTSLSQVVLASSSRSQVQAGTTSVLAHVACDRPSVDVR